MLRDISGESNEDSYKKKQLNASNIDWDNNNIWVYDWSDRTIASCDKIFGSFPVCGIINNTV